MIVKALRAAAVLAVLAIVFPMSGCIQYREEMIVLPDGSGKMVFHMGFNLDVLEKLKEMGMDPGDTEEEMEFNEEDVDNFEGIVALTKPKTEKKGNWQSWSVTAYFDDINKVKMFEKDDETSEKKLQLAFTFKKDGDGHALEIDDRLMENEDMEDMDEDAGAEAMEMFKEYTKGFEISRNVKMPGPVTKADGYAKKEGRTASNRFDESSLKDMNEFVKSLKSVQRKVVCGKSEMTDEDIAAFKKELADAKEAWPKIKAEMKAEAEKKKKAKKDE